jgi:hypothetical protein
LQIGDRAEKADVDLSVGHRFDHGSVALSHPHVEVQPFGFGDGIEERKKVALGSVFRAAVGRDQHHRERMLCAPVTRPLGRRFGGRLRRRSAAPMGVARDEGAS